MSCKQTKTWTRFECRLPNYVLFWRDGTQWFTKQEKKTAMLHNNKTTAK